VIGLCLALLLYVIGYGVLLAATHGLPYATDNNESFGAYFHGSSLVNFGLSQSFGLTDESFSPDPAAHPYVYTHGGNFPRVYTAAMYALGARSVESQIVIATFTVGLAGLALLYVFFASLGGALFATISSLVFASDYLFFAQWQVNSYRVWHTFLLFALLACTLPWLARRPRLQFGLVFAVQLCLVYFDLTFAIFASILVGLYVAVLHWRRAASVVRFWLAQAAGGLACVAILVVQNVAYMGWSGFQFDLAQTYGARNTALEGTPAGDQLLASLHAFYASNHIAFWRQLGGGGADRDFLSLLGQLFEWVLLPMTPVFSLVVLVIFAGWALSLLPERQTKIWRHGTAAAIVLGLAVFVATFAVLSGAAVVGQPADTLDLASQVLAAVVAAGIATAAVLALARLVTGRWTDLAGLVGRRVWLASFLLFGTAALVHAQPNLYSTDIGALQLLSDWLPTWLAQVLVLGAIAFAVYLVLRPGDELRGTRLLMYFACGFVAYVGVRTVLPGYVLSDYLERTAPIPVYVRDAAVALTLTLLIAVSRRIGANANASAGRVAAIAGASLVGVLAVFVAAFWINLQRSYGELIPPTRAGFLELLSQPPFHGATFVASQYAAPVAAQTGQWAYLDPLIASGQVKFSEDGFDVTHDDWYTWFADASSNPDYARPRYFLCFLPLSLRTAANDLEAGGHPLGWGCSSWQLVRQARSGQTDFPRDRVVATDPTSLDDWSIVQLDWDYPPYLRSIPDTTSDVQVIVSLDSTPSGIAVQPRYEARRQDGAPLDPAVLRLYADGTRKCVIVESTNPADLRLPPDFSGPVRVSVTPRTPTTSGSEYFSKPVWVGLRLFTLPNVMTGAQQHIAAGSLQEAEQMAEAAGTWNASAGTLGAGFQPVPGPDPCAGQ
jgi:hypothetical protein